MMSIVVPSLIYHFATLDPKLRDADLRKQNRELFEKEIKEIKLPPNTAVNKFSSNDKAFSILVDTRYRTELSESEFIDSFKTELGKKGWLYYGKHNLSEYHFCRGKADATIFSEGNGGLFSDKANYLTLSFSLGLRPQFDLTKSLPSSCR